jgi:hypothetical protein
MVFEIGRREDVLRYPLGKGEERIAHRFLLETGRGVKRGIKRRPATKPPMCAK